jgi:hypothetical protein
MKCLSFLGASIPEQSSFQYGSMVHHCTFVQEALCHFFRDIDELVFFVTDKALKTTYPEAETIAERINEGRRSQGSGGINLTARYVRVDLGKSEDELWSIFREILNEVGPNEEIFIDITYGLRTHPFLCFLATGYLRCRKDVRIRKMTYAAYEAIEEEQVPVIDLTPFTEILDWNTSAQAFVQYCDAFPLKRMLNDIQDRIKSEGNKWPDPPKMFKEWSRHLVLFSNAVRLSRPLEAINEARTIFLQYETMQQEIEKYAFGIQPIIGDIEEIRAIATKEQPDPDRLDHDLIRAMLEMIKYQARHGLYLQSMTLAREWLILLMLYSEGKTRWNGKTVQQMNEYLNGNNTGNTHFSITDKKWAIDAITLWHELASLRNDYAHCGIIKGEKTHSTESLVARSNNSIVKLDTLFAQV